MTLKDWAWFFRQLIRPHRAYRIYVLFFWGGLFTLGLYGVLSLYFPLDHFSGFACGIWAGHVFLSGAGMSAITQSRKMRLEYLRKHSNHRDYAPFWGVYYREQLVAVTRAWTRARAFRDGLSAVRAGWVPDADLIDIEVRRSKPVC